MTRSYTNTPDSQTVALHALGWIVSDAGRAERFLSLTGLDPAALRERIGDISVLGAALGFLMAHEPDLIACADDIGSSPAAIAEAARNLGA